MTEEEQAVIDSLDYVEVKRLDKDGNLEVIRVYWQSQGSDDILKVFMSPL